jgi:putative transposase
MTTISRSLEVSRSNIYERLEQPSVKQKRTRQRLSRSDAESRFPGMKVLPHKIQWLTDSGPGYVAEKTVLFGRSLGFEICTTAPYIPESKGMAEAFVKTFKRDYVAFGDPSSAERVLEQLPAWFEDYNEIAPHKWLAMKSPREYLRSCQHA